MESNLFLWETFKLKLLITFSKTLPKEWKYTIKSHLVNNYIPQNINLIKGLFYSITFENSYDLFTSSIFAIHYKNWLSYQILTRAQIEIFLFTHWLKENPKKIKDIFNEELYDYKKYQKEFYKQEKDPIILILWKMYNEYYSKKSHPLPTRFLSSISFYSFLKPKKENLDMSIFMNKKRLKEYNSLSIEEKNKKISELFEFGGYAPGINSIPHNKKDKKGIIKDVEMMIYLYNEIKKNLELIKERCEDYKMKDIDWDNARKKYQKEF